MRTAALITETTMHTALNTVRTPAEILGSTRDMLAWLEAHAPGPELTVLVDRSVMNAQGVPSSVGPTWRGLEAVHDAGWASGDFGPWVTYWRQRQGGQTIHIGYLPLIEPDRAPILDGIDTCTPAVICKRLDAWADLTGTPYHGTPGIAGLAILRNLYDQRRGNGNSRRAQPSWRPDTLGDRDRGLPNDMIRRAGMERDYTRTWQCPADTAAAAVTITLDANVAYLAAAGVVEVGRNPLQRLTHDRPVTPRRKGVAGYFKVELSTWNDPRIPDPAGYPNAHHKYGQPRWVTGPTLDLLDELTAGGLYGGYRILEEWTSPSARVLRPWADVLRDSLQRAYTYGSPALIQALKWGYRESLGLMSKPGGRIYRPDWDSAVIAQTRSNLWRKVYRNGIETGQWPVSFNVDAVTLTGATPPPAWVIHPTQLGAFKVKEAAV